MLPRDDELLRRAGLEDPPEPRVGLFREGCWLRRVSAEPALLFGGGRALLLEVAHPLVAAGVAEHSDFRSDPFGRLRRTLEAMGAIAFGDRATALAAVRRIEETHQRVRGVLRSDAGCFRAGAPYAAGDPQLLLWVWATLVDTALVVYERFVAPLDDAARGEYFADQRAVARLLGVPDALVPADVDRFRRYFDGMLESDALVVSAQGRDIAGAVLDPRVSVAGRGVVRSLTTVLLPERLREGFGLPWDAARAARVEALTASVRELRRGPSEP